MARWVIAAAVMALVGCSAGDGNQETVPVPDPVTVGSGAGGSHEGGGGEGGSGAGSGGGETQSPGYKSGARLKARRWVTDDGAEQFIGFHDSAMGFDCLAAMGSDGQRYCMAPAAGQIVYLDPGCSQPLLVDPPGCGALGMGHVSVAIYDPCGTYYETRVVGSVAMPGVVYGGIPGACSQAAMPEGTIYQLGTSPVPLSQLVRLDETVD